MQHIYDLLLREDKRPLIDDIKGYFWVALFLQLFITLASFSLYAIVDSVFEVD